MAGGLGKHCTDGEADALASRNGDLLATANRLDLTGCNAAQIPGAKTHQTHFTAPRHIFTYHFGEGIDDLAGLFEIEAGLRSDLVNQFIFPCDGKILFR